MKVQMGPHHALHREGDGGPVPGSAVPAEAQGWICEQPFGGSSEGFDAPLDDETRRAIEDDLGGASNVGGDGRQTGESRLDEAERPPLVVARQQREIRGGVEGLDVCTPP
jgi:hypothetical protein